MVARLALLAAIAAGGACYSPSFKDCELACSPGGDCPSGFECQGVVCRAIGAPLECPTTMPDAPEGDDAMSGTDAPPGIPPHPTTTWGTPTQISLPQFPQGLDDVTLTPDLLEMHGGVGSRIFVGTRPSPAATWGNFMMAPGAINYTDLTYADDAPTITADGLTMYWMSNRPGGVGSNDIWMAKRAAVGAPWVTPVNVGPLNSQSIDSGGSVSADGLLMALSSDRGGTSVSSDLFFSSRSTPTGAWSVPSPIPGPNTSSNDSHAVLSPDKLTLYFHSNRIAGADYEIFEAHRANAAVGFDPPRRLMELSTPNYDGDPWVSPDGHHMFFDRLVGGVYQLWETQR